jgi:hypothetical protein
MTDPQTILAEKLRSLEARVAMAEDDIAMMRRQQSRWILLPRERQIAIAMVTVVLVVLVTYRTANVH